MVDSRPIFIHMEDVIILGTGCAGLTAAIYTGRAQLNPLVLEGTQPGGQLTTTSEVENFPGFPEGIDGFEMMDNLRKQAARFGARYERAVIERIEVAGDMKKLHAGEKVYEAKTVIVATPLVVDGLWYTLITFLLSSPKIIDRIRSKAQLIDRLSGAVLILLAIRVVLTV